MSLNVILAVGLDPWLLTAEAPVWRSAGYVVVSAESIVEAMDLFEMGDFDLVLLGPSVLGEMRDRFVLHLKASRSSIPIALIPGPGGDGCWTGATLNHEIPALLAGMNELLTQEARKWPTSHSRIPPSRAHRAA